LNDVASDLTVVGQRQKKMRDLRGVCDLALRKGRNKSTTERREWLGG